MPLPVLTVDICDAFVQNVLFLLENMVYHLNYSRSMVFISGDGSVNMSNQ